MKTCVSRLNFSLPRWYLRTITLHQFLYRTALSYKCIHTGIPWFLRACEERQRSKAIGEIAASFKHGGQQGTHQLYIVYLLHNQSQLKSKYPLVDLRQTSTSPIIGSVGLDRSWRRNVLIVPDSCIVVFAWPIEFVTHSVTKPWQTKWLTWDAYQKIALELCQPHEQRLSDVSWQRANCNTR